MGAGCLKRTGQYTKGGGVSEGRFPLSHRKKNLSSRILTKSWIVAGNATQASSTGGIWVVRVSSGSWRNLNVPMPRSSVLPGILLGRHPPPAWLVYSRRRIVAVNLGQVEDKPGNPIFVFTAFVARAYLAPQVTSRICEPLLMLMTMTKYLELRLQPLAN